MGSCCVFSYYLIWDLRFEIWFDLILIWFDLIWFDLISSLSLSIGGGVYVYLLGKFYPQGIEYIFIPHLIWIILSRKKLVELALVSSLSSLGSCNDENTEWETKLLEVKNILRWWLLHLNINPKVTIRFCVGRWGVIPPTLDLLKVTES